MTPIQGAHIVTLHNPVRYTVAQLDLAAEIAHAFNRGLFVLLETPKR